MATASENIRNARVIVAVAGTDTPLSATDRYVQSVTVVALDANTDKVGVGGIDGVDVTPAGQNAFLLAPGDSVSFGPCNLKDVNVDVRVNNEGVAFVTEE